MTSFLSARAWVLGVTFFLGLCALFFWPAGLPPTELFTLIWQGSFGDAYAISETLVKATPTLWCALAIAIPAQLGLVSIGAEGQMYMGAVVGAAWIFLAMSAPPFVIVPGMLLFGAVGGFVWAFIPGWLKAKANVSETLVSLLLNFVALDLVDHLIHGPWKAPEATNWPQTATFPDTTILPAIVSGYRTHVGLIAAILASLLLHFFFSRTRWGLIIRVLKDNPRLAPQCGANLCLYIIILMGIGGLAAGIGGICEAAAIQNRIESHFLPGFGLSGYLVSWLAGHDFRWLVPLSVLMGAILASADTLQLSAHLPSSAALILQGFLFGVVIAVGKLNRRAERESPGIVDKSTDLRAA
jgi:simple sugar transport system permease protein